MRTRSPVSALATALALCLAAPAALALDLDGAKAAGQVGERLDGYVGAVQGDAASEEVRALVERINRGRREKYAEIARKHGLSVAAVAAESGVKLLERAPDGEYVMDATGRWKRK